MTVDPVQAGGPPVDDAQPTVAPQDMPILTEHYLRDEDVAPQVGDQVPLEILTKPSPDELAPVGGHVNPPPADIPSAGPAEEVAAQDGVDPAHVVLGDPSLAQPTEDVAPSSAVVPEPLDTDALVVPVSSDGGHTAGPTVVDLS